MGSFKPSPVPGIIAALVLLGAFGSWPYGYFIFLRWVVCAAAILFALWGNATGRAWLLWPCGLVALLFNPLVPVTLPRDVWLVLDVASAAIFVAGSLAFSSNAAGKTS